MKLQEKISGAGNQRTILLVEDEVLTALNQKLELEKAGYDVIMAHSGEGACVAFTNSGAVDLVLMDIDLGKGIDGPEAARQILGERDVPIVFLTSHSEKDYVDRVKEITRYGYVVKNSGDFVLNSSIQMAFELFESNRKMREAKDKLQATLRAMPDLVLEAGLDGRCYDYHSPRGDLLHHLVGDIIGKNIGDVFPINAAKVIMSAVSDARNRGISVTSYFEMTILAGTFWFEVAVSGKVSAADAPRFIILVRDVTRRMQSEEILRMHQVELSLQNDEFRNDQKILESAREKYFALYALAPLSYLTLDEKGVILEANPAAATLLGISQERLAAEPFSSFIVREDQDVFFQYTRKLFGPHGSEAAPLPCNIRMHRADGTMFSAYLTATAAVDGAGAPMGHMNVVQLVDTLPPLEHEKKAAL